jgi:acetylglutamate kinase
LFLKPEQAYLLDRKAAFRLSGADAENINATEKIEQEAISYGSVGTIKLFAQNSFLLRQA